MPDSCTPPDAAALFREHAERLGRYSLRLSGDPDVAEDVVQETFVRLIERPPEDARNLRGWLYATATNLVRDGARSGRRATELTRSHASLLAPAAAGQDPLRALEQERLRARLLAALGTLRERERVAVLMREEGFTHREIAEVLDTTTGTIGTLLARALAKLARALDIDGEGR